MAHLLFFVDALAMTLVAFLWQAALIGALYELVTILLRRMSARRRYLLAMGALLSMMASAVATFAEQLGGVLRPLATPTHLLLTSPPSEHDLTRWAPAIAALWITGVCVMAARGLYGMRILHRLETEAQRPPAWLKKRFRRLAARLHAGKVSLRLHNGIDGPLMVGLLRPVIYLPLSVVTSLPPDQIDAVLAHELGHVIRADFAWNLFQHVIETLFFFHPIVWRVSRVAREQRELCCDDIAVRSGTDPLTYASALLAFEELRRDHARGHSLAMAALGGPAPTLVRVTRILCKQTAATRSGGLVFMAIALSTAVLGVSVSRPGAQPAPQGNQRATALVPAIPARLAGQAEPLPPRSPVSRGPDRKPAASGRPAAFVPRIQPMLREQAVPPAQLARDAVQAEANARRPQFPVPAAQWAHDQANIGAPPLSPPT